MWLTRPDDTVDHVAVGLARGQLAIRPAGADDFPRNGIVETNRKPLDLERLPDLACKGFHVASLEAGRTCENFEGNLNTSDLPVDFGEQVFNPFSDIALDLRSLVIYGAEDGKAGERDQGQHGHED